MIQLFKQTIILKIQNNILKNGLSLFNAKNNKY